MKYLRNKKICEEFKECAEYQEKKKNNSLRNYFVGVYNQRRKKFDALSNVVDVRTFKGSEIVKIREPPVKGAINKVIAFVYSYKGPFKKLEKIA